MGCMAIVGTVAVTCALGGTIGASAIRAAAAAAEGNDAASGEGLGTTRRLVRVAAGATAADSADGDSGVTPLGISAAAAARIFSDAVRSGAGLSCSILSTVFSVTGFSLRDFSRTGTTFGCSVVLGNTVAAGAAAVMVPPEIVL